MFFDGNIRVQDEAGGAHFLFITAGFYLFVFFFMLLLKYSALVTGMIHKVMCFNPFFGRSKGSKNE